MNLKFVYRLMIILVIAVANISCDQYSKAWATENLKAQRYDQKEFLGVFFKLTYVKNEGAFLSLGSKLSETFRYWALKIFPILLLIGLFIHMLLSKTMTLWQLIAFSFILGGGLSNIYDRILYGSVVDFMNMGVELGERTIRTGIFNFADVSIMTGLFMMIPVMFSKEKPPEKTPKESEEV